MSLCGISVPFGTLSPTLGLVTHVLLTRAPLNRIATIPFDLHVLSAPLTFVLSQDQTLQFFKNCRILHAVLYSRTLVFRCYSIQRSSASSRHPSPKTKMGLAGPRTHLPSIWRTIQFSMNKGRSLRSRRTRLRRGCGDCSLQGNSSTFSFLSKKMLCFRSAPAPSGGGLCSSRENCANTKFALNLNF